MHCVLRTTNYFQTQSGNEYVEKLLNQQASRSTNCKALILLHNYLHSLHKSSDIRDYVPVSWRGGASQHCSWLWHCDDLGRKNLPLTHCWGSQSGWPSDRYTYMLSLWGAADSTSQFVMELTQCTDNYSFINVSCHNYPSHEYCSPTKVRHGVQHLCCSIVCVFLVLLYRICHY